MWITPLRADVSTMALFYDSMIPIDDVCFEPTQDGWGQSKKEKERV